MAKILTIEHRLPLSMAQQAYTTAQLLRENMERVVLGKPDVVQLIVIALLAGEHVLLEDVPG
ncbi:MAG: hypothetical protein WBD20_21290, partial [Pirellulaceae bacterium]